jgi:hypothetical protein
LIEYDGCLHDLVEIVSIFETSLRALKSEFGCKSIYRFCACYHPLAVVSGLEPVVLDPVQGRPENGVFGCMGSPLGSDSTKKKVFTTGIRGFGLQWWDFGGPIHEGLLP